MIKRYTPGIEQSHPELEAVAFMMEAKHGECVMYADHAAFVAQVREVAGGMEHSDWCDHRLAVWNDLEKRFSYPYACDCPRGKLLALCEETSNG